MHSKIVGGSTAERVINCPGSVALAAQMPPQVENDYMREGTRLHELMAELVFETEKTRERIIGRSDLTPDQEEKIRSALDLFESKIDPDCYLEGDVEARVAFPWDENIFGTADVIGYRRDTAVIIDWKFGDGVMVDAEENAQLLFYATAAYLSGHQAFERCEEVELIIVQPPHLRRWTTTIDRLERFNTDLQRAVKLASQPDASIVEGSHCRFCPAKAICPAKTGAADRAARLALENIGAESLSKYLALAGTVEDWAAEVRKLAHKALEAGQPVPGWKLVNKRAQRSWIDEKEALAALQTAAPGVSFVELVSPAQAEKALKAKKIKLPDGLTVAVSSGLTIAEESDPRPAAVNIGTQLVAALSKLS